MKRSLTYYAALVVLPLASWQCQKAPSGTNLQSLDNVARSGDQTLNLNQCGISFRTGDAVPSKVLPYVDKIVASPKDALAKNAVIGTLANVPENLLRLFFDTAGGQIIVGETTDACRDTPFTSEEREALGNLKSTPSCWVAPSGNQPLRIVLQPNPKLIRFALIRLFTFVQTEYFLARIEQPEAPAPFNQPAWQNYISEFAKMRDTLTVAFIADVKAQHKPLIAERLSKEYQSDSVRFGNIIYANAVDSYYCSTESKAIFAKDFKETWGVYTDRATLHSPINQLEPLK